MNQALCTLLQLSLSIILHTCYRVTFMRSNYNRGPVPGEVRTKVLTTGLASEVFCFTFPSYLWNY